MFVGVTLATVLADATTLVTEILPIIMVGLGFWGGHKVLGLIKRAR